MNFRSLEYFIAVVDEGNFTSAANKLYISQQALSNYITRLEVEMNATLLKRERPIVPTYMGRTFYAYAKEILQKYEDMIHDLSHYNEERKDKILVGEVSRNVSSFITILVSRYFKEYPEIEIILRSLSYDDMQNETEFSFFFTDSLVDNFSGKYVVEDLGDCGNYAVAVSQSLLEKYYGNNWEVVMEKVRESRDISLLKDLPFIMERDQYGRNRGSLEHAFELAGFKPKTVFRSERAGLNYDVCNAGSGALLTREIQLRSMINEGFKLTKVLFSPINIPDEPNLHLQLQHDYSKTLTQKEIAFLKMAKKLAEELMSMEM